MIETLRWLANTTLDGATIAGVCLLAARVAVLERRVRALTGDERKERRA